MSTFGYEEANPSSVSKALPGTQISINMSSPQTKKTTRPTNAEQHDASDALIRENSARARVLARFQTPPMTDRVEWFVDYEDGSRWHIWRVLIRDSWVGQTFGEGKVFDMGETMISGPGKRRVRDRNRKMADLDEDELDWGTKQDSYNGSSDEDMGEDDGQVDVGDDENLPPPANHSQSHNNNAQNGEPSLITTAEIGATHQPSNNSKVQVTTTFPADFEIYTETGIEEASQAQVHQHAQEEGQGEAIATATAAASMSVEMIRGRAVLKPLELPILSALPSSSSSALPAEIANNISVAVGATDLSLGPRHQLSSSPSFSDDSGMDVSGRGGVAGNNNNDNGGRESVNGVTRASLEEDAGTVAVTVVAERAFQEDANVTNGNGNLDVVQGVGTAGYGEMVASQGYFTQRGSVGGGDAHGDLLPGQQASSTVTQQPTVVGTTATVTATSTTVESSCHEQ